MEIVQENLYKALGIFIEVMRDYIVDLLSEESGDKWPDEYFMSLNYNQRDGWDMDLKKGSDPKDLIDFNNLKGFSLKFKELLKSDFGRKTNSLATWFEDIADARHKCQHFQELAVSDANRAYSNMITILDILGKEDEKQRIIDFQENKEPSMPDKKNWDSEKLIPWFKNVTPHLDIRSGRLDESIFAADLSEVASGMGREVYLNPAMFFSKTYFTEGLKNVARRVFRGLSGGEDAENRVISLQTGFGGGKTHTLISLYHLAKIGNKKVSFAGELIGSVGNITFQEANVAVFTNKTNDPTQGRVVDGINIRTLWGEIAYQLGGKEAYEKVRKNDEMRTAPKGLFKEVLSNCQPALILIDELADYCVAASGVTVGGSTLSDQTISFIQELSESIAITDKCVLVATLPASIAEVANSTKASNILSSLSNRLIRVGADTKPVSDEEIFEVIRRRLFENLGDSEEIEKTISYYTDYYQRLELPSDFNSLEYKKKLQKSYPFHPELIDIFRIRWASNHDFQRTRGVLRLLASIVADLWKRQESLTGLNALIHTSDVRFENLDALSGQLKKLYGNGYDAVMSADVCGTSSNAYKIDIIKSEYGHYGLTQGLASTILLYSFGTTGANKGISLEHLKLCLVKPDSFNHNNINGALDEMEEKAHYLYYSSAGRASKNYWFHTKPNINILINQAMNEIKDNEIQHEVLEMIRKQTASVTSFQILVNPTNDIPEQKRPTLIILSPDHLANPDRINGKAKNAVTNISTKKGNSERIYRNTILFLLCSEFGIGALKSALCNLLACQKVKDEYHSQLERDQIEELSSKVKEYARQSEDALVNAYSVIAKFSAKEGIKTLMMKKFATKLDIQINHNVLERLYDEEWLLDKVGLGLLKRFNLFPSQGNPVKTADLYEAFIRFDDKPMITGLNAVQTSLLRYCEIGELVIAAGEKDEYTKMYYKERVPYFDANDKSYWILDKSEYKQEAGGEETTEDNGVEEDGAAESDRTDDTSRRYKSITIRGRVDLANYHQLFTSFVNPLAKNNLEIEFKFKATSTNAKPIDDKSEQYKITRESAKQLGLEFIAEEDE